MHASFLYHSRPAVSCRGPGNASNVEEKEAGEAFRISIKPTIRAVLDD